MGAGAAQLRLSGRDTAQESRPEGYYQYWSVNPRKREAWIEDQFRELAHADADVLITNPRLVQTASIS